VGDRGTYQQPEDRDETRRLEEEKKQDLERQANEDKTETARLEKEKQDDKED
jgi:hypothetical protein